MTNMETFVYRKVIAYDEYKRVRFPLTIIKTLPEYNEIYKSLVEKNLYIITYTFYPNGTICESQRFIERGGRA